MPISQMQPTTSQTIVHTVGQGRLDRIVYMNVANPHVSSTVTFKLYVVPQGETVGDEHILVPLTSLAAAESYQWNGDLRLVDGDTIQVEASITLTLSATVSFERTVLR